MKECTFERFAHLARGGAHGAPGARVVPVWREVDTASITPSSAFARLQSGRFGFLLESAVASTGEWARYSFAGTRPASAWRIRGRMVEDWDSHRGWHSARTPADPLADLDRVINAAKPADVPELGPFWHGAVGFLGYDIVRLIERLPNRPPASSGVPDALFMLTRSMVIFDNLESLARIVIAVQVESGARDAALRDSFDEARSEIDEIDALMRGPDSDSAAPAPGRIEPASGVSSISRETFLAGVERIREYIRAGDCFQALLSRRIDLPADFTAISLYRSLRQLNPSPYMFHLVLDGTEIVGSSPELLVRLDEGRVTVRPIAGTRPRGDTPSRDAELSAELLADPKERAEHIMLVDLGRNDIGRVARFGTVQVAELMSVEKYSHVLHIVSEVQGEVAPGRTAMDVLRAVFPAGTMTGAPKVRAMEIIDELEPVSRGPYAGALGYIASGGRRMDLAITIRSCVIADGTASVQAGAGIVADSVAETEWDETASKARAVLEAIAQARVAAS